MSLLPIEGEELLKIGVLYGHVFGKRVINHLINKTNYCTMCGPLCIHCREKYHWFAGKIKYVFRIEDPNEDPDLIFEEIEEKLSPLDVLIIIGIPPALYNDLPDFLDAHGIRAVIFPIEDPDWMPLQDQLYLQNELSQLGIEYAFPRPFCNLAPKGKKDSLIDMFIKQFHIGKPQVTVSLKKGRIVHFQIHRSSPCGATFYITQHIRNEELNTWNQLSLEERVIDAMNKFPCIAANKRDPSLQAITRVIADKIALSSIKDAFDHPIESE